LGRGKHAVHNPDGSPYQAHVRFGWEAVVADAGLDKDVLAHVLRHTAATHLRVMGVSVMAMADLLGMNLNTAMTHHAHWILQGQQEAVDTLAYSEQ
jgi:integrase